MASPNDVERLAAELRRLPEPQLHDALRQAIEPLSLAVALAGLSWMKVDTR